MNHAIIIRPVDLAMTANDMQVPQKRKVAPPSQEKKVSRNIIPAAATFPFKKWEDKVVLYNWKSQIVLENSYLV